MCPDLLSLNGFSAEKETPKLQHLVINLNLLPFAGLNEASYCLHYPGPRGENPAKDMLAFSVVLAAQSPSMLRTLRVIYRQPLTLRIMAEDYVPEHKVVFIPWYEDRDAAGEPATADDGTPSIRPLCDTSDDENLDSPNGEELEV